VALNRARPRRAGDQIMSSSHARERPDTVIFVFESVIPFVPSRIECRGGRVIAAVTAMAVADQLDCVFAEVKD